MQPLYSGIIDQFAEPWRNGSVVSELEFAIKAQVKQRHGGTGRTKQKTRNYEKHIADCARDSEYLVKPASEFGLRVLFLAQKRKGDISNMLKAIEDALNRIAYHDDSGIDYLEVVRSFDQPHATILQVIER